jgi:hypothetical protein
MLLRGPVQRAPSRCVRLNALWRAPVQLARLDFGLVDGVALPHFLTGSAFPL